VGSRNSKRESWGFLGQSAGSLTYARRRRCGLLADTNTNGLHGLESPLVAFVETTCRARRDATF
jgi:hypothetical protein